MGTGRACRRRLSRRALLLHLTVAVVAPGCGVAGWWQATRALAGNGLSWVYSIEWPIFGLIAIVAWWQLIHEDPEAYEARKRGPTEGQVAPVLAAMEAQQPAQAQAAVEPTTARLSTTLVALVGVELLLGVASVLYVPVNRPSGWVPSAGTAVYLAHAAFGLLVVVGASAFLVRVGRPRAPPTGRLDGVHRRRRGRRRRRPDRGPVTCTVLGHGAHVLRPGPGRFCLYGPSFAQLIQKGAAALGRLSCR